MPRIRAITPIHVDPVELGRRQRRYDRLSPAGTTVALADLGDDPRVPRALDTADDVRRSEQLVVAEIGRTDPARFDAVLPDCVLDPGVGVVVDAPVAVLGLLRLCAHLLAGTGQRFAAVARNDAIAAELGRKLAWYGLAGECVDVRVLGLDVGDIADDAAWAGALTRAVADLPVPAVVNGCSAVDVRPADAGPRIVDPTATALAALGLADDLDLIGAGRAAPR
ncbi:MAG TPA: aspartate/glutamate racemase family protein [Micromonosporaceae bacterium]